MRSACLSVGQRLAIFFGLILVGFVITGVLSSIAVSRLTKQVARVDIAGRQRMLTQRFAKEVLLAAASGTSASRTKDSAPWQRTRKLFETTQEALLNGGPAYTDLAMQHQRELAPERSARARAHLEQAMESWHRLVSAASALLEAAAAGSPIEEHVAALGSATDECVKHQNSAVAAMAVGSRATARWLMLLQVFSIVGGFIVLGLIMWHMRRRLCQPLREAVELAERAAQGDLTHRCRLVHNDEVGHLAAALNRMCQELSATVSGIRDGAEQLKGAVQQLAATADGLADGASETSGRASSVASAVEEISATMNDISRSAESLSENVRAIAAAIEEITAAISETSEHAEHSFRVAENASKLVDESVTKIGELNKAAQEIGSIVSTIQEIAEQTNLLALNAAIEAARAGEAGRGFAVVATEVKDLAQQTADATLDIARRVEAIQQQVNATSQSMDAIAGTVRKVWESSKSIASVVDEQKLATREIAQTVTRTSETAETVSSAVAEATAAINDIAEHVAQMDQGARNVEAAAEQTRATGRQLAGLSEHLHQLVRRFRVDSTDDQSRSGVAAHHDEDHQWRELEELAAATS